MCTLTYVPFGKNRIITSSRDENPVRIAIEPNPYIYNCRELFFPKDVHSQGSWLVSDKKHRVSSLLNGGFEKHVRKDGYRLSRGIVHLDLYGFSGLEEFTAHYELDDIEPFTLVSIEDSGQRLLELIWTGNEKHLTEYKADEPKIWSSSTLYSAEARDVRRAWFERHIDKIQGDFKTRMLEFHSQRHSKNEEINILMNREKVRTTSISQIWVDPETIDFTEFITV